MIGGLIRTLRSTPEQEMGILSPEEVKSRREIARRLMEQAGDYSPVASPLQGAARASNAILGAIDDYAATSAERRGQEAGKAIEASLLSALGERSASQSASAVSSPDAGAMPPVATGSPMNIDPRIREGIASTASALGIDPVDLATAISYETAGTFDPMKKGPTTQWGQHRGLIQFGEPQARQHGVDWSDPIGSQLGENGAVANYLRSSGVKPGMGMLDIYSAINAGAPGRYNASDANNGGAPGTVRDKVEKQMVGHRAKAMALFGGDQSQQNAGGLDMGQLPAAPQVQVAQAEPNRMSLAQLMALKNSPGFTYAPKGTQSIVDALIQREVTQQAKDPRDSMIKDLNIERMRNELANSGLTRRQQELAIRRAEQDLEGKPNIEIIRDAATGEIIAVDKNDINSGVKKLREAGPSKDAPVTKQIKQPDGSEVAVQWDAQTRSWVPLKAPEGGASIRAPGKLTEQQSKDLVYYNRGLQAMETFGDGAALTGAEGLAGATIGQIPVVGNYAKSKEFQMAEQAGRNYLASILRKDTGAAITANEEKIYGEVFLPRPGDDPATIKQKAEARKQAIDAIRDGLGPAEVLALGQRLTRREDAKVPAPDVPTKRPPEKDPLGLFQ